MTSVSRHLSMSSWPHRVGGRMLDLDERFVKDYKMPKRVMIVNTIVARTPQHHELWLKIKRRHFLIGVGQEAQIFEKKQKVERFLGDCKNWQFLDGPKDIIELTRRL